jgi:hypothetical protein
MKNNNNEKEKALNKQRKISRRDAMTKIGTGAFSVTTMLLLLNKPITATAHGSIGDEFDPGDPGTW